MQMRILRRKNNSRIYSPEHSINNIMKKIVFFFLVISVIVATGCINTATPAEKPIGKGYVNLCTSDPAQADHWQTTDDILWNKPLDSTGKKDSSMVTQFSSCDNTSAIILETKLNGAEAWDHVIIQSPDGNSHDGWLPDGHLHHASNETGTEWSNNFSSVVGLWDRTAQGNAAKIWYDFRTDGSFTFNYDMRGNRDTMQDRGSWEYMGNNTYLLISGISAEHRHTNITINPDGKTFDSGTVFSSDSGAGQAIVYAKER